MLKKLIFNVIYINNFLIKEDFLRMIIIKIYLCEITNNF